MKIAPITFREASDFINMYHRHHKATIGCKFCICVKDDDGRIHGVAVCGRPVSRMLDDGTILEINRVCSDGTRNVCSMLYGACFRIAKDMGYRKVITYTLISENGASLQASNFTCEGEAGGAYWRGTRNSGKDGPAEMKMRWTKTFYKEEINA